MTAGTPASTTMPSGISSIAHRLLLSPRPFLSPVTSPRSHGTVASSGLAIFLFCSGTTLWPLRLVYVDYYGLHFLSLDAYHLFQELLRIFFMLCLNLLHEVAELVHIPFDPIFYLAGEPPHFEANEPPIEEFAFAGIAPINTLPIYPNSIPASPINPLYPNNALHGKYPDCLVDHFFLVVLFPAYRATVSLVVPLEGT